MKMIFDVETNGLFNCSVLSFSCLILDDNNNIVEVVDRYYYRLKSEKINNKAISINHLTDKIIKEKRKNVTYHKYFKSDPYINKLFKKVNTLIAHNIKFDLSHISKKINIRDKEIVCTMLKIQYKYDAPYLKYGEPKYPKLSEAIEYYNIDIEKIRANTKLDYHSSLFDCYCVYEIYKRL